jgi:predicted nucleotidyltransferase
MAGNGHFMTKKEQFMAFILVGATARDIHAAKVYLAFCSQDGKRPHRWMLKKE